MTISELKETLEYYPQELELILMDLYNAEHEILAVHSNETDDKLIIKIDDE